MRCPKGFHQHPPKSGICVPKHLAKTQKKRTTPETIPKKKRCPNGTRKNKAGECVSKSAKKLKSKSKSPDVVVVPKYHDIAADVFPKFKERGYILDKYYSNKMKMVEDYVKSHSSTIKPGDILFIGSTNSDRYYEDSFVLVGNEGRLLTEGHDTAADLPIMYKKLLPSKISYKKMFDEISNMDEDNDIDPFSNNFFGLYEDESVSEVYEQYESNGML